MIFKLFKYLSLLFFLPLWYLQLLIPRNKKVWVFGAWYGKKYSDNARVLFEYVNKNHPEIKAIWITKNNKVIRDHVNSSYIVYKHNSLKGIYYSLIAKVVVFSSGKVDVNLFFIIGATLINTWHGAPMKKIGLDDKFASITNFKKIVFRFIYPFYWEFNIDYIVSTAEIFNKKLSSAFNVPIRNVILSGYPRCDLLYEKKIHPLVKQIRDKFINPTILFYLPTFRSENERFSPFDSFYFNEDDWDKYLKENNYVLLSKGHFVDNEIGNKSKSDRIMHVSDTDIPELNSLLKDIDILITDYSGVFFDFLLTKKPIILAPFDIESYLLSNRELYFNYIKDISCGDSCNDWHKLMIALSKLKIEKNKALVIERNVFFNSFDDNNNSKRLFNEIVKRI